MDNHHNQAHKPRPDISSGSGSTDPMSTTSQDHGNRSLIFNSRNQKNVSKNHFDQQLIP